jgi:cytochrome bd-type quinol oxidase subunit 2
MPFSPFVMRGLLEYFGIKTRRSAKFVLIYVLLFLVFGMYLSARYPEDQDTDFLVFHIFMAIFLLAFAALSAWALLTKSGQKTLSELEAAEPKRGFVRIWNVVYASLALAVGIFIILLVCLLWIAGPDAMSMFVTRYFLLAIGILALLCFPFVYKNLK